MYDLIPECGGYENLCMFCDNGERSEIKTSFNFEKLN